MKPLEKYIQLENTIDFKMIDTKKEPPVKIKNIYKMIENEIKEEIKICLKDCMGDRGVTVDDLFKKGDVKIAGGAISDLFIKNNSNETKDYDFFITNNLLNYGGHKIPKKCFGDIVESVFGKEKETEENKYRIEYDRYFQTKNIYKVKRTIDGQEINIDIIVTSYAVYEFDLSFREFFYDGETIIASRKAIRDIENHQITVNTLMTPRQTFYRLKEFEERFGMAAAPVEKYILMKYINEKYNKLRNNRDKAKERKIKYFTEERKRQIEDKDEEGILEHEVYTTYLRNFLNEDNGERNPERDAMTLEKARKMYELGIKENELCENMKIQMPVWKPREMTKKLYEEVKFELVSKLKDYNRNKSFEILYGDNKIQSESQWLQSDFSKTVSDIIKDFETKNGNTTIQPSELLFLLQIDEDFSEKQTTILGEEKNNYYFGDKKTARKITKEREMNFNIELRWIYTVNEYYYYPDDSVADKTVEIYKVIRLKGETGVEIIIKPDKTFNFLEKYGYLSAERVDILKQKIESVSNFSDANWFRQ